MHVVFVLWTLLLITVVKAKPNAFVPRNTKAICNESVASGEDTGL